MCSALKCLLVMADKTRFPRKYSLCLDFLPPFLSPSYSIRISHESPLLSLKLIRSAQVSASSPLYLSGSSIPSTGVTYNWTETTGQLDLTNKSNFLTSPTNVNFVIKSNVLKPGATYTFQLAATNINGTGTSSVGIFHGPQSKYSLMILDVTISAPPFGGTCTVLPATGFVVKTTYTLDCEGWQSGGSDGLKYSFSYMQGNTEVFLARNQQSQSISSLLPLPATADGSVTVKAYVSSHTSLTIPSLTCEDFESIQCYYRLLGYRNRTEAAIIRRSGRRIRSRSFGKCARKFS